MQLHTSRDNAYTFFQKQKVITHIAPKQTI